MIPTLKTRKPVDELTQEDLSTFRIWEYALDEEESFDETHVRPVDAQVVPHDACVEVAARYRLNSGTVVEGFARVTTTTDPLEIWPSFVFFGGKTIGLPEGLAERREANPGIEPGRDLVRENLPKRMGLPMADILPASYELLVLIGRETQLRAGVLE